MAADQKTPLPGYPQYWGSKMVNVVEVNGPTLYAAGGQQINASDFGWGGFDACFPLGLSLSGTYYAALVQNGAVDATPSVPAGSVSYVKVQWFVTATNLEAGALDLSNEIVRLMFIGV